MKSLKTVLPILVAIILLEGCSTQSKFASSFGKRRYEKGFYWNSPGKENMPTVANNSAPKPTVAAKSVTISSQNLSANRAEEAKGERTATTLKTADNPKSKTVTLNNSRTEIKAAPSNSRVISAPATPRAIRSITSHHFTHDDSQTNDSHLGTIGGILCVISVVIFLAFLLDTEIADAAAAALLAVFAFFGDIAGIAMCIVALAMHTNDSNIAIIGLVANFAFLIILGILISKG